MFAGKGTSLKSEDGIKVVEVAPLDIAVLPIIFSVPLQMLVYHVAVLKGTVVDQPRNLAKSVVTVE